MSPKAQGIAAVFLSMVFASTWAGNNSSVDETSSSYAAPPPPPYGISVRTVESPPLLLLAAEVVGCCGPPVVFADGTPLDSCPSSNASVLVSAHGPRVAAQFTLRPNATVQEEDVGSWSLGLLLSLVVNSNSSSFSASLLTVSWSSSCFDITAGLDIKKKENNGASPSSYIRISRFDRCRPSDERLEFLIPFDAAAAIWPTDGDSLFHVITVTKKAADSTLHSITGAAHFRATLDEFVVFDGFVSARNATHLGSATSSNSSSVGLPPFISLTLGDSPLVPRTKQDSFFVSRIVVSPGEKDGPSVSLLDMLQILGSRQQATDVVALSSSVMSTAYDETGERIFAIVFATTSIACCLIAIVHVSCLALVSSRDENGWCWSRSRGNRRVVPAVGDLAKRIVGTAQTGSAAVRLVKEAYFPPAAHSSPAASPLPVAFGPLEAILRGCAAFVMLPVTVVLQGMPLLFTVWAMPTGIKAWWNSTVAWVASFLAPLRMSVASALTMQATLFALLLLVSYRWLRAQDAGLFNDRTARFAVATRAARQLARLILERGCHESNTWMDEGSMHRVAAALVASPQPLIDLPHLLRHHCPLLEVGEEKGRASPQLDRLCAVVGQTLTFLLGAGGHFPVDDGVRITLLCFFARSREFLTLRAPIAAVSPSQLDWVARRINRGEDDVADALEMAQPSSAALLSRQDRCVLRAMFDDLESQRSSALARLTCSPGNCFQQEQTNDDVFSFRIGNGDHHVIRWASNAAVAWKMNVVSPVDVFTIRLSRLSSTAAEGSSIIPSPDQNEFFLRQSDVARLLPVADDLVRHHHLQPLSSSNFRFVSGLVIMNANEKEEEEEVHTKKISFLFPQANEPDAPDHPLAAPATSTVLRSCFLRLACGELLLECDDEVAAGRTPTAFRIRVEHRYAATMCPAHQQPVALPDANCSATYRCCHVEAAAFYFCTGWRLNPPAPCCSGATTPGAASSPNATMHPLASSSASSGDQSKPVNMGRCSKDPADSLFVCSAPGCTYALCAACLADAHGGRLLPQLAIKARMVTRRVRAMFLDAQHIHGLILMLTQFLLFPLTQLVASIVKCFLVMKNASDSASSLGGPMTVQCNDTSDEKPFHNGNSTAGGPLLAASAVDCSIELVAVALVIFLTFRVGICVMWTLELRRRKHLLSSLVLPPPSSDALSPSPDHLWSKFLLVDDTVWSSFYRAHEHAYMAWDPGFQLFFQVALCAASSLLAENSLQQRVATASIEGGRFVVLTTTNYFIDPWMDALAKTSSAHQLLQMAWSQCFSPPSTSASSPNSPAAVAAFALTLTAFCSITVVVLWFAVLSPIAAARRAKRQDAVLKRETQLMNEVDSGLLPFPAFLGAMRLLVHQKKKIFGRDHFEVAMSLAAVAECIDRSDTDNISSSDSNPDHHQQQLLNALTASCNALHDVLLHPASGHRVDLGMRAARSYDRQQLLTRVLGSLSPNIHSGGSVSELEEVLLRIIFLSRVPPAEAESDVTLLASASAQCFSWLCALRHGSRGQLLSPFEDMDFSHTVLAGADFLGASFHRCSFAKANLLTANMEHCVFSSCDFSGAVLSTPSLFPTSADFLAGETRRHQRGHRRPFSSLKPCERPISCVCFVAANSLLVSDATHGTLQTCDVRGLSDTIATDASSGFSWGSPLHGHKARVRCLIASSDRRLACSMDELCLWAWTSDYASSPDVPSSAKGWMRRQLIFPSNNPDADRGAMTPRLLSLFGFFNEGRSNIVFAVLLARNNQQQEQHDDEKEGNPEGTFPNRGSSFTVEFHVLRTSSRRSAVQQQWALDHILPVSSGVVTVDSVIIDRTVVHALACPVDGLSLYDRSGTLLQRIPPPTLRGEWQQQRYLKVHGAGKYAAVVCDKAVEFFSSSSLTGAASAASNPVSRSATEDFFTAMPWPPDRCDFPPPQMTALGGPSRETSVVFLEDDRTAPSSPIVQQAAPFSLVHGGSVSLVNLCRRGNDELIPFGSAVVASCTTFHNRYFILCANERYVVLVDARSMAIARFFELLPAGKMEVPVSGAGGPQAAAVVVPTLLAACGEQLCVLMSDGKLQLHDISCDDDSPDDFVNPSTYMSIPLPPLVPTVSAVSACNEATVAVVTFEGMPTLALYFPEDRRRQAILMNLRSMRLLKWESNKRRDNATALQGGDDDDDEISCCCFVSASLLLVFFKGCAQPMSVDMSDTSWDEHDEEEDTSRLLSSVSSVPLDGVELGEDGFVAAAVLAPDAAFLLLQIVSSRENLPTSFVIVHVGLAPASSGNAGAPTLRLMWQRKPPEILPSAVGFCGIAGSVTTLSWEHGKTNVVVCSHDLFSGHVEPSGSSSIELLHAGELALDAVFSPSAVLVALRTSRRILVLGSSSMSSVVYEAPFMCHNSAPPSCFVVLNSSEVVIQERHGHVPYVVSSSGGGQQVLPLDALKHVVLAPGSLHAAVSASSSVLLATDRLGYVHAFQKIMGPQLSTKIFSSFCRGASSSVGAEPFSLLREGLELGSPLEPQKSLTASRAASPTNLFADRRPSSMFMSTTSSDSRLEGSGRHLRVSSAKGWQTLFSGVSMPQSRFLLTISPHVGLLVWSMRTSSVVRRFAWGRQSRPVAASAMELSDISRDDENGSPQQLLLRLAVLNSCATETKSSISVLDIYQRYDCCVFYVDVPTLVVAVSFSSRQASRLLFWLSNAPYDVCVADISTTSSSSYAQHGHVVTDGLGTVARWSNVLVAGLLSDSPLVVFVHENSAAVSVAPLYGSFFTHTTSRLSTVDISGGTSWPTAVIEKATTASWCPLIMLHGREGSQLTCLVLSPNGIDGEIVARRIDDMLYQGSVARSWPSFALDEHPAGGIALISLASVQESEVGGGSGTVAFYRFNGFREGFASRPNHLDIYPPLPVLPQHDGGQSTIVQIALPSVAGDKGALVTESGVVFFSRSPPCIVVREESLPSEGLEEILPSDAAAAVCSGCGLVASQPVCCAGAGMAVKIGQMKRGDGDDDDVNLRDVSFPCQTLEFGPKTSGSYLLQLLDARNNDDDDEENERQKTSLCNFHAITVGAVGTSPDTTDDEHLQLDVEIIRVSWGVSELVRTEQVLRVRVPGYCRRQENQPVVAFCAKKLAEGGHFVFLLVEKVGIPPPRRDDGWTALAEPRKGSTSSPTPSAVSSEPRRLFALVMIDCLDSPHAGTSSHPRLLDEVTLAGDFSAGASVEVNADASVVLVLAMKAGAVVGVQRGSCEKDGSPRHAALRVIRPDGDLLPMRSSMFLPQQQLSNYFAAVTAAGTVGVWAARRAEASTAAYVDVKCCCTIKSLPALNTSSHDSSVIIAPWSGVEGWSSRGPPVASFLVIVGPVVSFFSVTWCSRQPMLVMCGSVRLPGATGNFRLLKTFEGSRRVEVFISDASSSSVVSLSAPF